MTAADDVARMLTLVPWLLERPGASLDEIAAAFDVPPPTIERDLYHLDFCGLPGLGGGALFDVSIVEGRVVVTMADELTRPLRPTRSEALRLLLTASSVAAVVGDDHPALRSAIDKVRAALDIDPGATVVVEPATGLVDLGDVRLAIRDGRRVRLSYQGRRDDAPRRRDVDPWALHVDAGVVYLQGYAHEVGERRTFRLDRAAAFEVLNEAVTHEAPSDVPAPSYVPGPGDLEVVLEVDHGSRWIVDALDVDEVTTDEDGELTVRLRTDTPTFLARLVLTAGGGVRVQQPAALATIVRDAARHALAAYELPS